MGHTAGEMDPKVNKGIAAINRRVDLMLRIKKIPLSEFTVGDLSLLMTLFSSSYNSLPDDEVTKLEKVAEAWEKAQAKKAGKR